MSVVQSQAEFCLQWNLGVEFQDRQLKKPAILLNTMKSLNSQVCKNKNSMEDLVQNAIITCQAEIKQIHTAVLFVLRFYSPVSQTNGVIFSGRERMTTENISWSNLHKRMFLTWWGWHP